MQSVEFAKPSSIFRFWKYGIGFLCFPLWFLLVSCAGPGLAKRQAGLEARPGPSFGKERAIGVVQKSSGVFYYRFRGNNVLKPLEPYKDYISKQKVSNSGLIAEIKALLKENESFQPSYKKRCLPKWEDGLEFRTSKAERRMILFSFSCGTMMIFEEKLYRDFEPQRVRLYALLRYQINSKTSLPLSR